MNDVWLLAGQLRVQLICWVSGITFLLTMRPTDQDINDNDTDSQYSDVSSVQDHHRNHKARTLLQDGAIPLYRVDLSAPPESRYTKICEDYKHVLIDLVAIYEQILALSPYPRLAGFLARNLLKRVYSAEETAEIKAISHTLGTPIHLTVAFNTFLDLFAACMSGGAKIRADGGPSRDASKMVHFRNLDWEMDLLRELIIRVEYVRDGAVVARYVYWSSSS